MSKKQTTSIVGCARCEGTHENIEVRAFTHPPLNRDGDAPSGFTHFAICPATKEPILMFIQDDGK